MATTLHVTSMSLGSVRPETLPDGTLTGLAISVALQWSDEANAPQVGTTVDVDVWALLSEQQKANMQDISNTIAGYLAATYLAP